MNIYFLDYNNYYNRIIKKEETLNDYLEYQIGEVATNINFIPNDGIVTELVVNRNKNEIGDYLLAVNELNEIDSRWFIIEADRLRTGQYKLTLRRDVVSDNYRDVVNAPCFIEKATLDDNDPMIYNKEDMTFNQIKTSETPLKDETGCAWVVGYIPRDSFKTPTTIQGKVVLDHTYDLSLNKIEDWEYFEYYNNPGANPFYGNITNEEYQINIFHYGGQWPDPATNNYYIKMNGKGELIKFYDNGGRTGNRNELNTAYGWGSTGNINVASEVIKNYKSVISTMNKQAYPYLGIKSDKETQDLIAENNKVIYEISSGLYYRIKITNKGSVARSSDVVSGNLFNTMKDNLNRYYKGIEQIKGNPGATSFQVRVNTYSYLVELEQIPVDAYTVINQTRYHLEDQPYDMFCIPYSDDLIMKTPEGNIKANKSIAINMAIEIGADAGTSAVYDVQLLPYCPVRYCIKADGSFDVGQARVHYIRKGTPPKGADTNPIIGLIMWATTSELTFNIDKKIDITNKKIQNQTDKWRICSPNYNGIFEFNAAMNNGVELFNVDCNYKPFNPYIHINPNFKNLYGQDFNDARGLVCGGDFSLPQITNAWADYQLSNKNYQQIFDRQIQNMEVNNSVQRTKEIVGAVSGSIGGAVSGAAMGGTLGPIGAVAGAIGGGILSAAGGVADVALNDKLRNEAIDYTKDNFGYQLGNIQALPSSLARTTAFTANNKIFPFIEYYTCTDVEKQAFRNKLKYNGMTVMRIGRINEFIKPTRTYIKGRLIRLENINDDFHMVKEIANELNKGVFI